ncbi:Uncharacterised protein [Mycobacteroides abscessus subsp. abscessus]|nr:Uncharacterised protein [Mycobacteroides abscessus subsp. abscessus]
MVSRIGQTRCQSHRGGTAADESDSLTGDYEVVGPFLRMYHRPGEIIDSGEFRKITPVVSVVARAHHEK